jgi:KUP system potassium uptake protein
LAVVFFLVFGFVDANFLAANLTKFVTGGWFSVGITLIITAVLVTWRLGRHAMVEEQRTMSRPMSELYKAREERDDTGSIVQIIKPVEVTTPLLICFSSTPDAIPAAFAHFSRRLPVRPRNVVFVTVQAVNVAFVETHLELEPIEGQERIYRLVVHHGYSERPPLARKIAAFIIRTLDCFPDAARFFPPPSDAELLRFVDPTFVVGHDRVVAKPQSSTRHLLFVEMFQVLYQFSRSPANMLAIPPESALEVGLRVPI